MKRPEGFDASPPAPESPPDRARGEKRAAVTRLRATRERAAAAPVEKGRTVPAAAPRASSAATDDVTTAPVAVVRRPAERRPRVSPEKQAVAELRRAERARRRAEKQELRRFTRRQRHRRAMWWSLTGVVAVLTALILIAVFSPLLALREVRVEGTQRIDPALVVDALDGQLGTPLALLDEGLVRDELDAFTLIRSYTTELAPPGTLIVRITERTPVGTIIRGATFDLVDAAGVVIESSPERVAGMPVIQVPGDDVESRAYASITEVLFALPADIRAQVDTIAASTRDNVTLQLAGSNQRVEWGSAQRSDHKARVLAALVAIHGGDGSGLYDVSAPGSAVFRRD
ncbi:FtsQ-type POTRA domain-containing protein [Salinibacterium sp. ZJ70]|uniref:FtsQ-type POTRA domain-containing protein n=1 Tax=Salinibacterium sp. ZJ70 TaxID=2708084 RepID=UPI001CD314AE|nr:FtsQ-type POTRA domain-containing protein [Salinibacterium sp. ZJ70]